MNNATRVTLIVVLSFLLVFFCYKLYLNLTLVEKPGFYDFEKSNIQEKIVGNKKVLTEKNLGITMQIPNDWEYEYKSITNGFVANDPAINVEFPLRDFRDWTKGCSISIVNKGEETLIMI